MRHCSNCGRREQACVLHGRRSTGASSGVRKGGSGPASAHRIANQFLWKHYQFLQDGKHYRWAADIQPSAHLTKQMEGGKLRVNTSSLCPPMLFVGIPHLVHGCDTCAVVVLMWCTRSQHKGWWKPKVDVLQLKWCGPCPRLSLLLRANAPEDVVGLHPLPPECCHTRWIAQ